jgi:hypothetical protein
VLQVILSIALALGITASARQAATVDAPPALSEQELQDIYSRVIMLQDTFAAESLQPMGIYVRDGALRVMVRNRYNHREQPDGKRLESLGNALYAAAGRPFPLVLEPYSLPEQPEIEGRITAIDEALGRVLIVDAVNRLPNGAPGAVWAKMYEDGIIVRASDRKELTFRDLALGQRVEAWSYGIVLNSYPGQTELLELSITDQPEEGDPYIPVTSILGSDLEQAAKIEVRYGDGSRLTIEDSYTIGLTVHRHLRLLVLQPCEGPERTSGYLYKLHLEVGNQTLAYSSDAAAPAGMTRTLTIQHVSGLKSRHR